MNLELVPLLDYGLGAAAELLSCGFADYFVTMEFNTPALVQMLVQDGIDASSSRVVFRDAQAVGIGLIARRGWTSRVAGMAIVPEARGAGIGQWLMAQLLTQARLRGERRMVLEVIEQNTAAVRLYHGCGFQTVRRLLSYAATPSDKRKASKLEEANIHDVARLVTAHGLPDLPWQVSGESLALIGPPNRAYRREAAYVVISDPTAARIGIRSILVEPHARRQGQAARLLQAITSSHSDRQWLVPTLCPEEIGGLFEKVGFERGPLSQYQMSIDLV